MKCPLFGMAGLINYSEVTQGDMECSKEECAWWQSELGNCIIYQLGMEIGTLCLLLEERKDKMPHEEQFRK